MSSVAAPAAAGRVARMYRSAIGKKAMMAATGVILFGFVVVHMLGNLLFFLGPDALNAYGEALQSNVVLVWGGRMVLLGAVALHIVSAAQLAHLNRQARPQAYAKLSPQNSSYASRTMYWSGPMLAAFVLYHLAHLTAGSAHPDFVRGDVYHNVVMGFSQPLVVVIYVAAMAMLGMHLYHGAWSMFQSLGFNHPRYTPMLKRLAKTAAAAIVVANCSIPIAVLAGFFDASAIRI
jgi:succinate dehydrogenase / fumarate reductase cytochrome b subunit